MAVRKQRTTTSETYAMDKDYNKVLTKAKRLHRLDEEFYICNMDGIFSSISKSDVEHYSYDKEELEHWAFNKRWVKQ